MREDYVTFIRLRRLEPDSSWGLEEVSGHVGEAHVARN